MAHNDINVCLLDSNILLDAAQVLLYSNGVLELTNIHMNDTQEQHQEPYTYQYQIRVVFMGTYSSRSPGYSNFYTRSPCNHISRHGYNLFCLVTSWNSRWLTQKVIHWYYYWSYFIFLGTNTLNKNLATKINQLGLQIGWHQSQYWNHWVGYENLWQMDNIYIYIYI